MKFTALASSSQGNCYLLSAEDNQAPLLIEAGLPLKKIREALNYSTMWLAGCLVSHSHGDHSRAVKEMLKAGIDVYMTLRTSIELGVNMHHRCKILHPGRMCQIEDWRVLPFSLAHDIHCIGFFIGRKSERFLYVSDTAYVANRFKDITMIAIECNYITELLKKNVFDGRMPDVAGKRIRKNHMSLESLIQMLKANDLSKCKKIYLLHLSDSNSDEAIMIQRVQEATGIPTYAMATNQLVEA